MVARQQAMTYNLDRMQYAPGPPPTFNAAETPQGAEWWVANQYTDEGAAILAFLADAYRQLSHINRQHMAAA